MCHKAVLITIMKIKRTAGGDPFWAHYAHLELCGWGRWAAGEGASFLGLGFHIPDNSTEIDSSWSRHSGFLSVCFTDVHTAIL